MMCSAFDEKTEERRESRTRYLPGVPSDPSYPEHFEVRLVAKRGAVCWRKKPGFISNALVKRPSDWSRLASPRS